MLFAPILLSLAITPASIQEDSLAEARQLLAEQSLQEATAAIESALESGAAEAREAHLLLAEVQIADGRPESAVATLDDLGLGEDHDVRIALAHAYLAWSDQLALNNRGDDAQMMAMDARAHLERAVKLAPDGHARAAVELGNLVLYREGDHKRALEIANQTLTTDGENGEMLLLRGCAGVYVYWNAREAGREPEAAEAWQASVDDLIAADKQLPPDRVEPWYQLAWLYETKGEASKAVDAAIEIVDRSPETSLDELYRMAKSFANQRRFDASSKALAKIVATSARDLTINLRREEDTTAVATELAWSVGPFVTRGTQDARITARQILGAITQANPQTSVIWDNYAVLSQETGEFEQAIEAYERRLKVDGNDPRTYNDLAAILQYDLRREQDRARELYEKCIAMADEQLGADEVEPAWRSHLLSAKNTARDNLNNLTSPSGGTGTRAGGGGGGGLLDALREGLRNIEVPEVPADGDDGEAEGEAKDADTDSSVG